IVVDVVIFFSVIFIFFVFFFQAEDGIRDSSVTGVQTCALPISQAAGHELSEVSQATASLEQRQAETEAAVEAARKTVVEREAVRSEERRVGKECRSRWGEEQ